MIVSRYTYVKVAPSNFRYWEGLGYSVERMKRQNASPQRIKVSVNDLLPGSNVDVACHCDECGKKYVQRFCRDKSVCYECRRRKHMVGNTLGSVHKGKKHPQMSGENHPRWNPNKTAYKAYWNKVRQVTEETYTTNKSVINPTDLPRTLCGVERGWQLDHRISVKRGYLLGINPKVIGGLDNLQMLPWESNRAKWHR